MHEQLLFSKNSSMLILFEFMVVFGCLLLLLLHYRSARVISHTYHSSLSKPRALSSSFLFLFAFLQSGDVFLVDVVLFGQNGADEVDLVALDEELLSAGFLTRRRGDGSAGGGADADLLGQSLRVDAVSLQIRHQSHFLVPRPRLHVQSHRRKAALRRGGGDRKGKGPDGGGWSRRMGD